MDEFWNREGVRERWNEGIHLVRGYMWDFRFLCTVQYEAEIEKVDGDYTTCSLKTGLVWFFIASRIIIKSPVNASLHSLVKGNFGRFMIKKKKYSRNFQTATPLYTICHQVVFARLPTRSVIKHEGSNVPLHRAHCWRWPMASVAALWRYLLSSSSLLLPLKQ